MEVFDVLIIGGGPAAITISKIIGGKVKAAVIRPEDHSMIYCAMPYVIEGVLPIEKSFKKDSLVTASGVELIRDYVNKIDFENKLVITAKNKSYGYKKLIIATGAKPIVPPIEGSNLEGVVTFKNEDDLRYILKLIPNLKNAVVVGAGAIGIELAQAFQKTGLKTYLVDMANQILPNLVDEEMTTDCVEELKNMGIELLLNKRVARLRGKSFVEGIVFDNGEEIDFDRNNLSVLVAFVIGMKPNLELFEDSPLELGRDGIIVNEKLETNLTDVYAVGDCIQFKSAITGEIIGGKLATNAVAMARVLAKNLIGDNRVYRGFINGAATKVGDYYIGGTGLTEKTARKKYDVIVEYAELYTAFPIMPFAKKAKMKIIVDKNTLKLVGGQIVAGTPVTDKVDILTMALQYKIPVNELVYFSYSAQPYQSFFPANNLLIACCEKVLSRLKKD